MESGEQLSVIFCARSIVSADIISVTPIIIFIIAVASKYSVIHGKWHGLAVEGEKKGADGQLCILPVLVCVTGLPGSLMAAIPLEAA